MSGYIQNIDQSIVPIHANYRDEGQVIADEKKRAWNICACQEALTAIPDYRHKLTFDILGKLAPTVESCLKGKGNPSLYVRKSQEFPRKFHVDRITKRLLIISEKHGVFQFKDRYIKICDAVQIQFSKQSPPVARHVLWMVSRKNTYTFSEREIKIEQLFTNILDVITFSRSNGGQVKGLVIAPYDASLATILPELSPDQCLEVAMQLTDHLRTIHKAGFVHANIKAENVQVTKSSDGSLQAQFFNFRHAYDPTSKKKFPRKGFLEYNYGSELFTAPERERTNPAIKQLKDKRKQAEAEDLFAFGCLLIELQRRDTVFCNELKGWDKNFHRALQAEIEGSPASIDKEILKAAVKLYTFTPHKRSELDELSQQFAALTLDDDSSHT